MSRRERKGMSDMLGNRIQRVGAVGLVVTIGLGLFFVLAVQAGLTAATGTSRASASAALQGEVRIHLTGR